MSQLIETRWARFGKERVYLKTPDGIEVGHIDLQTRTVVATVAHYEAELQDCLARWTAGSESADVNPGPAPEAHFDARVDTPDDDQLPQAAEPPIEVRDLAENIAGAAVRAKREEVNAQAPVRNLIARVLGVKTEERAWRVGAKGEEKVAQQLAALGPDWRVLHAVEVGQHGSDIDHVVIGPAGVFTLNAKRHPNGRATIYEHAMYVNGQKTDYLRNSRFEARRASKLLTAACGRPVPVQAAIVLVDLDDYTVKHEPAEVHVINRLRVVKWLLSLPQTLDAQAIELIYSHARLSTTWK